MNQLRTVKGINMLIFVISNSIWRRYKSAIKFVHILQIKGNIDENYAKKNNKDNALTPNKVTDL